MKREFLRDAIAFLLVLLFVYTAFSKILGASEFRKQMFNQPLPAWVKPVLVYAIPSLELVASILLMIVSVRIWGFVLSSALMITFTIYVGLVLLGQFDYTPCSCGGIVSTLSWRGHLIFNVVFTVLALIGTAISVRSNNPFQKKKIFT